MCVSVQRRTDSWLQKGDTAGKETGTGKKGQKVIIYRGHLGRQGFSEEIIRLLDPIQI